MTTLIYVFLCNAWVKSIGYETLKQVQGDRKKTFARASAVIKSS